MVDLAFFDELSETRTGGKCRMVGNVWRIRLVSWSFL